MLHDHPDRPRVLAELHARPFSSIATPARFLHFAFLVDSIEAEHDCAQVERMVADESKESGWLAQKRYLSLEGGRFRWERHGEFVSYTLAAQPDAVPMWPTDLVPPGVLLVAVDLRTTSYDQPHTTIVNAPILGGNAQVSSDFAPNAEGFVEITIVNRHMSEDLAGATVQRVLELETYRCLALLGLPVAEKAAQTMGRIEKSLPAVMERMATASTLGDNRDLLDRLTSMTVELERSSASTHFRFGATRAYAELVRLRLEALSGGVNTASCELLSFFSRRFEPAIRTCLTAATREANLSRKLTRAAQLLRTRVEIALESQNRDLLEQMGERLQLQVRLQQTVEGLSIAAISYYVAGLFHLLVSGFGSASGAVDSELLTAVAILPIVATVAIVMSRLRRHHQRCDQMTAPARGR